MNCQKCGVEHKSDNKNEKKPMLHCVKCGNWLSKESVKIGRNLCGYCR